MRAFNKKTLTVSLAILVLILITMGITYAFFSYTKFGSEENQITTGTIKFIYVENIGTGNGISITNAFPVSDQAGMSYTADNQVFDFKVESTQTGNGLIPYEVTLRKKKTSTLDNDKVKVYLTDMTENNDNEILEPTLFSGLDQTDYVSVDNFEEKVLYQGRVPSNVETYIKKFRLRMWVDEAAHMKDVSGQNFTAMVNVYANAQVISDVELDEQDNIGLNRISIEGIESIPVEDEGYDYLYNIKEPGTFTINVETENPNSTVKIERIENSTEEQTEQEPSQIATKYKIQTFEGDNIFKITIISESKKVIKEYTINITTNNTVEEGYVWNFDYLGKDDLFRVPISGTYKLEVWGAQGGTSGGAGGYGAYSEGNIKLKTFDKLYVNVGNTGGVHPSQGSNESNWKWAYGGYNGGGNGYGACGQGGGGGATHIALEEGVLNTLKDKTDKVLIVASGGGGGSHWFKSNSAGKHGGGYAVTAPSKTYASGSFGLGGNGRGANCGGGAGGGGYTGGNGGGNVSGGGGGSSFIGNLIEGTRTMYCYNCGDYLQDESKKTISATGTNKDATLCPSGVNSVATSHCAKSGKGYARITYLGD